MSENRTETTDYKAKLEDITAVEASLYKQEKILKAYADYRNVPKEPPPYTNRASLAMITLSGTWIIFDAFAFFMDYTEIGIVASIFTAAMIIFFIVLKVRGTNAYKKLMAEYKEYIYVYEQVQKLEECVGRTKRLLEKLYEESGVHRWKMQKGRVRDKGCETENDIISVEQITEYCEEVNHFLDEIEKEKPVADFN